MDNISIMMVIDRPSNFLNETNEASIYITMYIFTHNRDTSTSVKIAILEHLN